MKYYYYLPIFLLLPLFMQAQATLVARGDKAFRDLRYVDAIDLYRNALAEDSINKATMIKLAESYYRTQQYDASLSWYHKAIQADAAVTTDTVLYRYAQLLAMSGQYPAAAGAYRQYMAKGHPDEQLNNTAQVYENNISSFYKDTLNTQSRLLNINSGYADFCPVFVRAGLAFVSDRPRAQAFKKINGWTGGEFLELFYTKDTARVKDVMLRSPELEDVLSYAPQNKIVNDDNDPQSSAGSPMVAVNRKLNYKPVENQLSSQMVMVFDNRLGGRFHLGPMAFSHNQDTAVITYNYPAKQGKNGVSRLQLQFFKATRNGWGKLPDFPYNSPDYNVGHGALHPNGKVLFFTSDMPGGLGGKDLYYCLLTDKGWAPPVNAGPLVNTAGNEMFPYVSPEGVLYFSSDRWPGLGGLDIFSVKLEGGYKAIAAPQNAGAPLNSRRNDFGVLLYDHDSRGYFSSDRRGNDDIYRFSPVSSAQ